MGRPQGSKNKRKPGRPRKEVPSIETSNVSITEEQNDQTINDNESNTEEIPDEKEEEIQEEKPLLKNQVNALGTGEKYFEAPDGTILVGSANADRLWYRAGNHGRGMWINPKRV